MRLAEGPLWRVLADRTDRAGAISRRPRPRRRAARDAGDVGDGQARHRRPQKGLRGQVSRLKSVGARDAPIGASRNEGAEKITTRARLTAQAEVHFSAAASEGTASG